MHSIPLAGCPLLYLPVNFLCIFSTPFSHSILSSDEVYFADLEERLASFINFKEVKSYYSPTGHLRITVRPIVKCLRFHE